MHSGKILCDIVLQHCILHTALNINAVQSTKSAVYTAHCTLLTFAFWNLSLNCVVLHSIEHPCTISSPNIINIHLNEWNQIYCTRSLGSLPGPTTYFLFACFTRKFAPTGWHSRHIFVTLPLTLVHICIKKLQDPKMFITIIGHQYWRGEGEGVKREKTQRGCERSIWVLIKTFSQGNVSSENRVA